MAQLFKMKRVGPWDRLLTIINPVNFDRRLDKNIRIAHRRVGLDYRKDVRTAIRGKKYAPNKAMTVAIKGSSTPLVDNADMINAIAIKVDGSDSVEIGIKRSATGSGGKKLWNVAEILHKGVTVTVTERMRNFFKVMFQSGQRGWRPLNPSTTVIRIPGRPFFSEPLADNEDKYIKHYEDAVIATMKGK